MTVAEGVVRSVPLTVLTGFLGAGKTTVLNRILSGAHGLRVAVLVNDFGSVSIDAELVVGVANDGDIIDLANGCVCCNIRGDLVAAVEEVLARPERPECIVLEASGVAEPSGIALTFMDEDLRTRIRLDSIMCLVDAEQVFALPETLELKLRQIAFSDMVILNKVDLVTREHIARIKAWLDDRFHRYRLVEASNGDVPLEILLAAGRFDPAQLEGPALPGLGRFHPEGFRTWSYETSEPISVEALRMSARKLPASVYRCKGVVHTIEEPSRRTILQVVGKRVDIEVGQAWDRQAPRTRIVVIGADDRMDEAELHDVFDGCCARA